MRSVLVNWPNVKSFFFFSLFAQHMSIEMNQFMANAKTTLSELVKKHRGTHLADITKQDKRYVKQSML